MYKCDLRVDFSVFHHISDAALARPSDVSFVSNLCFANVQQLPVAGENMLLYNIKTCVDPSTLVDSNQYVLVM